MAEENFPDQFTLHAVDVTGANRRRLDTLVSVISDVIDFAISPDGKTTVYQVADDGPVQNLFSVPTDGGSPVEIVA